MSFWLNIRHSIFFKFALAFLIVGLVPTLVLSTMSVNQLTGQFERHTENNFKQTMLYLSKNVDSIFFNYNEISKKMYYRTERINEQNYRTIQQEIDELGQLNQTKIDDFLRSILFSDAYIQNAFFVRSSDQAVFYQSRVTKALNTDESYPPVNWAYTLEMQPKKLAVFPPHLETYYNSTRQVMTFGRSLIDMSKRVSATSNVLGTLYFDIELDVFAQLFRQVKLGSHDAVHVVDAKGYILFSNQSDKLGKRFDEPAVRGSGKTLVYSEPVPFMGGQIVGLVSKSDLYASVAMVQNNVAFVAVVCLFALIVLGTLFSRMFTRPILDIKRLMLRVESGHLETGAAVKRKDELGRLANGFNRMIERLQAFINDAYVAEIGRKQSEIKRKQTELNALKSQIRPHYLYNTLEVIRMRAVHNDDSEVADMIHSLSNQLKYVIDYGEEWVTIRRELKHLRDYFHLIEVRFDKRIELQIDVQDESLLDSQILKLTIQPLVENAVIHGVRPRGGRGGTIMVTVNKEGEDRMAVTVYDNGVGMDAETVIRLNRQLEEGEGASGKSIGVKNVHERLRNACGESFGLVVESMPNIGTSVRMFFPLRKEEAHDGDDTDTSRG